MRRRSARKKRRNDRSGVELLQGETTCSNVENEGEAVSGGMASLFKEDDHAEQEQRFEPRQQG